MKNRIISSVIAGAAILLGSVALASPASASGGNLGAVGKVCVEGAGTGTQVKVTQTALAPLGASTARSFDAAIAAQATKSPASAAVLAEQRDRNAIAGVSTQATLESDAKIAWRAITDAQGCVFVPATGAQNGSVGVAIGSANASVTYAPSVAFDPENGFVWTDRAVPSSAKIVAPERALTQSSVVGGRVGFEVSFTH